MAKGNPVKVGNMEMRWLEHGNELDHTQGHFVGDHILKFGYFLVIAEHLCNDVDKICF